jgi:predicted phage tail protein
MTNEYIFWTQIGSLLGYIGMAFYLYKVLIAQKDATISHLIEVAKSNDKLAKDKFEFMEMQYKEKVAELEKKVDEMKNLAPDIVAESLSKRNEIIKQELKELQKDQEKNAQIIISKTTELNGVRLQVQQLYEQIERAKEYMTDLVCPYCEAIIIRKEQSSHMVEHNGHDYDIETEIIEYACGLLLVDGNEESSCKNAKNSNEEPANDS